MHADEGVAVLGAKDTPADLKGAEQQRLGLDILSFVTLIT
jgi:hypothetical protein